MFNNNFHTNIYTNIQDIYIQNLYSDAIQKH